eukprot:6677387-Prymnesium_polylepis.1
MRVGLTRAGTRVALTHGHGPVGGRVSHIVLAPGQRCMGGCSDIGESIRGLGRDARHIPVDVHVDCPIAHDKSVARLV